MEISLNEILNPDEKLLWSGKPEAFTVLDKTYKKRFVTKLAIAVALFAVIVLAYVIFCSKNGIGVKPVFILIIAALMMAMVIDVFQDAKKLRKAVYAVTDKRLIVILDTVRAVELAAIKEARFMSDEDGHTSLLCGKYGVKTKASLWRTLCVTNPDIDEKTGLCQRFGFYAVEGHDQLKQILRPFLPV